MPEVIGDIVIPSVLVIQSGAALATPSTLENGTIFVSGGLLSFISGSTLWTFDASEV